jgi:hypothetical protein
MVMFAHFVNMLLKMAKILQHSDVTGISATQNVLIITRILTWVETDYTYAQWDAKKSLLMYDFY